MSRSNPRPQQPELFETPKVKKKDNVIVTRNTKEFMAVMARQKAGELRVLVMDANCGQYKMTVVYNNRRKV